jgi:MinD-like ATPase involved in chromosome partitioning or flagellar assembly
MRRSLRGDVLRDAGAPARVDADILEISAGRGGEKTSVHKYAGCANICAEARMARAAARGPSGFAAGKELSRPIDLISFVGIDGGAGASSLALGLAGELSAYRGRRVLYLSFESFESPHLGTGGRMTSPGGIDGFLFAFLRDGADVSAEPYMARDDHGVMRFAPSGGLNRLRELNEEELGRFLAAVTRETAPDAMVVDWGGGLDRAATEHIRSSAFTVLVARHEGVKSRGPGGSPSLLSIADELGIDRSRVVVAVNRAPAAGDDCEARTDASARDVRRAPDAADGDRNGAREYEYGSEIGRMAENVRSQLYSRSEEAYGGGERREAGYVEICEDPYAFDRDAERVSISLATAFGTGVKQLADIVTGAEGASAAGREEGPSLGGETYVIAADTG